MRVLLPGRSTFTLPTFWAKNTELTPSLPYAPALSQIHPPQQAAPLPRVALSLRYTHPPPISSHQTSLQIHELKSHMPKTLQGLLSPFRKSPSILAEGQPLLVPRPHLPCCTVHGSPGFTLQGHRHNTPCPSWLNVLYASTAPGQYQGPTCILPLATCAALTLLPTAGQGSL